MTCNTYWGSHACDLDPGHDGDHQCGDDASPCSQYRGPVRGIEIPALDPQRFTGEGEVREMLYDEDTYEPVEWGEWHSGWDGYSL